MTPDRLTARARGLIVAHRQGVDPAEHAGAQSELAAVVGEMQGVYEEYRTLVGSSPDPSSPYPPARCSQ